MVTLAGKKVLFVAPRFFGYDKEIADELARRGASVDVLLDRPFDSPLFKAATRFLPNLIAKAAQYYYRSKKAYLSDGAYDFIFVINGQTLNTATLREWRTEYANAKFILYMWDSFGNRRAAIRNLIFFDQVFSFDRNDSAKYGLHFRPLFFSKIFERAVVEEATYAISFVGTVHTDRYAVISSIIASLDTGTRSYWYLFLQAKWVFWVHKLFNPAFRKARQEQFSFTPLSKGAVQKIFMESKAILDIEHPKQTGLTMRTLETLGAKKKLVTTNASIINYDFYSVDNIWILERDKPFLPMEFLSTPYVAVPDSIYQRYSLEGWLDEIFSLGSMNSCS